MSWLARSALWICCLTAFAGASSGEELPLLDFRHFEVPPELRAAAEKVDVPLEGFSFAPERAHLHEGDAATVLITATEGESVKHWLVYLYAKDLNEKERARPPAPTLTLYSTSGRSHLFQPELGAMAMRVLGPYTYAPKRRRPAGRGAKDVWAGALIDSTALALGFDRMCRVGLALSQMQESGHEMLQFGWRGEPFTPEETAATRAFVERFGVSEDDERALIGGAPALGQFIAIAAQTPGVREILLEVVDLSWKTLLFRGGRMPEVMIYFNGAGILEQAPQSWGLEADGPIYTSTFRVDLDRKPSLEAVMAVTAPEVPLRVNAGILALTAQRPNGQGPRLDLRVIASRTAPP